jgi:hypothetical protein
MRIIQEPKDNHEAAKARSYEQTILLFFFVVSSRFRDFVVAF